MPTAANSSVKLNASSRSASAVRPASRAASAGVHSPRAPARNANACPASAEEKRAGSTRRASADRATRGPKSAVPKTAASSPTASAVTPSSPRGAATTPVAATTASTASTSATPARSHALSMTMVASAEPAPQPPRARGVTGTDRQHVVQQAAGRVHRKSAHHPDRRQRPEQPLPAAGAHHAGDHEDQDHQRQHPPALDPNVRGHVGQRNGADPQPQQGDAECGLKSESYPAVHMVAVACSGWSDGSAGRIQRCTNIQKANSQPTTSKVPP